MAEKRVPPWLFALTGMPYGVVGSFTGVIMPYLASRADIDTEKIGWLVTLLFLPPILQFLYAPVVDFGPQRKHWLIIVTLLGAGCLFGAFQMSLPDNLTPFLMFAFAAQMISGLVGSCNGGLMATVVSDADRGKAGAWYNVGNLSGGGIAASVAVYMTGHHYAPTTVGAVLCVMMIVPAFAVLMIEEPPRVREGSVLQAIINLLSEVRSVLWTRAGITGLLLCLSPVGTAALANYFSAIAKEYVRPELAHAMSLVDAEAAKAMLDEKVSSVLAFVGGPLGQGLTALGALVGGFLCDRTNRRAMYLLSGALTAVVGLVMAISPRSEMTFTLGALTYALVTGFCYAAFTATVLETIGKDAKAASTRYSLFVAAGNAAIAYVGLVNTRFSEKHGVEGVVGSDAALNIAGVIVLGLVFWKLGSFGKSRHSDDEPPAKTDLPVAVIQPPKD
jgi:PAT family beta-lactamase induction signal transducer AmpG